MANSSSGARNQMSLYTTYQKARTLAENPRVAAKGLRSQVDGIHTGQIRGNLSNSKDNSNNRNILKMFRSMDS